MLENFVNFERFKSNIHKKIEGILSKNTIVRFRKLEGSAEYGQRPHFRVFLILGPFPNQKKEVCYQTSCNVVFKNIIFIIDKALYEKRLWYK